MHLFVICVSSVAKFPFELMAHLKLVFSFSFAFLFFCLFSYCWILRLLDIFWIQILYELCNLWYIFLGRGLPFNYRSGSLEFFLSIYLSPPQCSVLQRIPALLTSASQLLKSILLSCGCPSAWPRNSLKAVTRVDLNCFPFLGAYCPSLPHVSCLKNYCFIYFFSFFGNFWQENQPGLCYFTFGWNQKPWVCHLLLLGMDSRGCVSIHVSVVLLCSLLMTAGFPPLPLHGNYF